MTPSPLHFQVAHTHTYTRLHTSTKSIISQRVHSAVKRHFTPTLQRQALSQTHRVRCEAAVDTRTAARRPLGHRATASASNATHYPLCSRSQCAGRHLARPSGWLRGGHPTAVGSQGLARCTRVTLTLCPSYGGGTSVLPVAGCPDAASSRA